MATIKLELFTSKKLKKDKDRHPIYITVVKDGIPKRKKVGAATVEEWDEEKQAIKPKGRKDHVADNIYIEDEYSKYKAIFNNLDRSGNEWSAEDVFAGHDPKPSKELTFYQACDQFLANIPKANWSHGTVSAKIEKIKRYTKQRDFSFDDLDGNWIAGFITHCKTNEKDNKGGTGNSKNTITYAFKFIKRIYSFAGKDNPALKKLKLSKTKPLKQKLTMEEINKIADLDITPGTLRYHARNIFLVQFYFRGMRIGDALRLEPSDIVGDRLAYSANKTEVNYDMKIVKPCLAILQEYLNEKPEGYLFPFIRRTRLTDEGLKNEIKNRTGVINWHLKEIAKSCGIEKNISTHIARHSFGSIADKQLEGNLKTLQALFGHSSRAMTEEYIRELRKTDDLDDAADQVF
jgi:integrase